VLRLAGVRALVIEDHEDTRDLFCTILQHAGATVDCHARSSAAIEAVDASRPDVIIADLQMAADDVRLMSIIQERLGRPVPAICVTGHARAEDHERARRAGFQEYIVKPFHPDRLIEAVERVLIKPAAGQEQLSMPSDAPEALSPLPGTTPE